jgi:hypothetical protein
MIETANSVLPAAWVASFREWFGLSPSQARLLVALYRARGGLLDCFDLSQLTGVTEHAVLTHLCHLRRAMRPEALDCERQLGYRLSEVGVEECRQAMEKMAADMRRGEL